MKKIILIADDDLEDQILMREAIEELDSKSEFHFVTDGEEMMSYLQRKDKYKNLLLSPLPQLIILDLNMPKKNGHEVLGEIKKHEDLKHIPIIVFTGSNAEKDLMETFELGIQSFITKPARFDGFVEIIRSIEFAQQFFVQPNKANY